MPAFPLSVPASVSLLCLEWSRHVALVFPSSSQNILFLNPLDLSKSLLPSHVLIEGTLLAI